ncbi:YkgJ family cysteine cluster protein [Candidatus Nitrososphaera sp. FF02]|uniref:YkgJ family cysteine cluster protein n=1 Tax=Candidatus Nitrososphaera sp. FF02 TaxID=3398226 RepID=UPI0039E7D4D7
MQSGNSVKESLDALAKKWDIDPKLYDMQVGLRDDVIDNQVNVGGVVFHVPMLSRDSLYILWKCLWPDCHNCCERQGRLPLTKDDIALLTKKLGYDSKVEFVKQEARISSWQEQEAFGSIITTLSMLSLKRKKDEREEEDGTPLRCRFLDDKGYCGIHPDKPGVCWLYPFASWLESDRHGKPVVHATFQFTGDCPGFYLDKSLDNIMPVLQEYAQKIYSYNMAVQRTTRENYGFINFVSG